MGRIGTQIFETLPCACVTRAHAKRWNEKMRPYASHASLPSRNSKEKDMITEQDFQVPPGVADALRMAAVCHTPHTGVAAIALIRAAADILCNDLGAEQTCSIINQVTTEALALHAPAGRA